ncbi:hypothetical protein I602_1273 [Polaribacter dokdonensis DSW-5]|uniref:SPOR domain-containing protein n=1 Tax=Polaribacter dokdonensis DSW-5 TaxID=1300348 RepID=A0A0M9CFZ8_9FLAO|nr:hypothetical protein I602_1273 [Polaribacter dokdonensis DSW-5]
MEKIFNRFSSQSFVKQNTYLLNPTFTVVNETNKSIAILSRNSFIGFEGSPVLNILGFSGRIDENIGAGVGIYRQRIGVFTNFGAIANYAYKIQLSAKSNLSVGFNFMFSHFDLDRTRIVDPASDAVIFNFQEKTNMILQSGINYNYGKFNIGVNLRDIVDYNLKEGEFITPFSEKSFSIHAQFTEPLKSNINLLKDGVLRFFYSANYNSNSSSTGNVLFDVPKLGWIQGGYDDFFGSSAGLGIRLSQKVAISYVYETGKNDLGPTSELGIVYSFSKKPTNTITYNTSPKTEIDTIEENLINTETEKNETQKIKKDTINSKQIKIVKNEDDVLSINKKITALQNQIDSLKAINKTKSIKNEKDSISLKNKIEEFQNQKDSLSIENKNKKLQNEKDSILIKDKLKTSQIRKDSIAEEKKKTAVLPKMEIIKKTDDLEEGFYLIVNVFSQEKYANSFVENLKENDLNPKYFIHPIKKYRYVYISFSKSKREILKLIYNNVNGKYVHDKWILQVEN